VLDDEAAEVTEVGVVCLGPQAAPTGRRELASISPRLMRDGIGPRRANLWMVRVASGSVCTTSGSSRTVATAELYKWLAEPEQERMTHYADGGVA
jgi:hypothetical protein